jgi:hypothetical protein
MTVRVEVPEGCKFCTRCGGVKPIDQFRLKSQTKGKAGVVTRWRDSRCDKCRLELDAERRRRRLDGEARPNGRPPAIWGRTQAERDCDAALMGWRVAHHATVVAFQGPRL